jgi:hypothetical protein
MFLDSRLAVIAGIVLALVGTFKALSSRQYADAAQRELIFKGNLTHISRASKSPTYFDYEFIRNGFVTQGESLSCHSAQSWQGCQVGAPVLVYYDPEQKVETTLEEYGVIGQEKLLIGVGLIIGGLLLAVLHFVFKKMAYTPDSSESGIDNDNPGESEVPHIVPRE